MLEIIEQGGRKMAKGNLSETVDEILKSIGVKKSADKNEKPEDEVVLFIRRSDNTLKGTIRQLLAMPEALAIS